MKTVIMYYIVNKRFFDEDLQDWYQKHGQFGPIYSSYQSAERSLIDDPDNKDSKIVEVQINNPFEVN